MASTSYQAFETAIADAERLLVLFDKLPKPEQQTNEVLKRAALIMTLTAWETYIEAWLKAQIAQKLTALEGLFASACDSIKGIHKKFTESINQLSMEFCSQISLSIGFGTTSTNRQCAHN